MEQHAIPQQISSYEFKLVGEMTLKQFFKAAIGLIIAGLIYSTKLIFIIKWPLMIFSAGLGLSLAFVPFQDRPLEVWLIAFIKSIYSPTIFLYRRGKVENWLDLDLNQPIEIETQAEEPDTAVPIYQKDTRQIKDLLKKLPSIHQGGVLGGNVIKDEKQKKEEEITFELPAEPGEVKAEVLTPPVQINKAAETGTPTEDWRNKKSELDLKTEKLEATGEAVFGSIPMPSIPDTPNVIVGMVTSREGKLTEGAIVEIQDELGNPNRVLKTNPLGQFKTSTPLPNGKYLIIVEKEGMVFDRINVTLEGKVLQPLRIVPNN